MKVLVSGATTTVASAPAWVGRLIVPRARNRPSLIDDGRMWAGDNGCLSGFDAELFLLMLEQFQGKAGCLFVAAPDVVKKRADGSIVGDANATLAKFERWARVIRSFGYPVALVLQDGIRPHQVPWDRCDAVFVGGSTAFKYSDEVAAIVALAQANGKHTHMGRVAGPRRWHYAKGIGIETIDSSGYSKFCNEMLRRTIRWKRQPHLPLSA